MSHNKTVPLFGALIATAVVAACGGGGGGGGSVMNPPPQASPAPSSSPVLSGTMNAASGTFAGGFVETPVNGAAIVFSCGCTTQAGTATTTSTGGFTLVANSTPTPSAPNPTYTIVPGRNYVVVATTSTKAEAWDLRFAGKVPGHNVNFSATGNSDVYTSAASLYVYFETRAGSATAFDNWNFNAVKSWYSILAGAAPGPNSAEQKLLNDIAAATSANTTLYPSKPTWNSGQATNATIAADLTAVKSSGDGALPTPCSSCTGTPTP